ncbi:hypothetical protein IQ264_03025 [Phormidium sp. LEGE 05292]|nr:hypothetical protein [Phormidium sp. LEGE 05292]MBE9224447.1 hypothetical protein [Phormidium sp. LEGE 05292]
MATEPKLIYHDTNALAYVAIAHHTDTLREDRQPIPEPSLKAKTISVAT